MERRPTLASLYDIDIDCNGNRLQRRRRDRRCTDVPYTRPCFPADHVLYHCHRPLLGWCHSCPEYYHNVDVDTSANGHGSEPHSLSLNVQRSAYTPARRRRRLRKRPNHGCPYWRPCRRMRHTNHVGKRPTTTKRQNRRAPIHPYHRNSQRDGSRIFAKSP